MKLDITYRGSLSSCDYDCNYCPFAKTHDDKAARDKDKEELKNFTEWLANQSPRDEIRILFTPWGEALVRKWYREALTTISHLRNISKVAIQTNLSSTLDWLENTNHEKIALWTTFHPSQTSLESFIEKSHKLVQLGIPHSVGIVGKKEHIEVVTSLKKHLDKRVHLWINAFKDEANYYTQSEVNFFTHVDQHFPTNLNNHESFGKPCSAGETSVSINGEGDIYTCHFVKKCLGNIYKQDIRTLLKPSLCPENTCDCYIGYRHLKHLNLEADYKDNIVARIPTANI